MSEKTQLVIVSGLSGSGKTIALNALEDIGYYCIDNLPMCLTPSLTEVIEQTTGNLYKHIAIGIDARSRSDEIKQFPLLLAKLKQTDIEFNIVFLQANSEVILKRFSETRRKHPLTHSKMSLIDAIEQEKLILAPIVEKADVFIDTSNINVHALREIIRSRISHKTDALSIMFQSFGFKYGAPNDADFVFDVRCLPNPHWEPELRSQTGRDQGVIDFLSAHESVQDMTDQIQSFLSNWIPQFERDNRSYLTIAIGCTGGQHRSVYSAEKISQHFIEEYPNLIVRHRELS
ncbi:MAG: RNase adapter RapZ [Methylococcales bacterium]|jgi:RNase adapter protein RapZ|nr:RNase adapter RapZ [Methylococcales bacterium]MBT7445134.1 RNase adapter RapZ [Methylococcales bacterium]